MRISTSWVGRAGAFVAVLAAGAVLLGLASPPPAGAAPVGTILGVQKGIGIFAMGADGSDPHILIPDPSAISVAAAPRGSLLAHGDAGSAAVTVTTDSGAPVGSVEGLGLSGSVTSISWSPDGSRLAYTVCGAGGTAGCEVAVGGVAADAITTFPLPSGIDPDQGLTWGAQGLIVAGSFGPATSCPGCNAGLYVLDPTGQMGTAPLYPQGAPTGTTAQLGQPAVAADGSLAYIATLPHQVPKVLVNAASGPLTASYAGSSSPAWSPDASTLVVTNGYQVLESRPSIGGSRQIIATFHSYGIGSLTWEPGPAGNAGCSVALKSGAVQDMAGAPNGHGYWVTDAYGAVSACGDAGDYGGLGAVHLNEPVLSMASTPDGRGYWLVAYDGGVFTFGDALPEPQNGAPNGPVSLGGQKLAAPIWSMAPTPSGHGYLLVGTDGGVFTFGDAHFYGSAAPFHPSTPVVALTMTVDGKGYWIATANGTVYAFGDAQGARLGTLGPRSAPIVAMAADPAVQAGYWLVDANGVVYPYGGAPAFGSLSNSGQPPVRGIASTPDGTGYWLADANGGVYPFGAAPAGGNAD